MTFVLFLSNRWCGLVSLGISQKQTLCRVWLAAFVNRKAFTRLNLAT